MDTIISKICTKCKQLKLLEEFSKSKTPDGLRYWCKSCCSEAEKQRCQNPEIRKAKSERQRLYSQIPEIKTRDVERSKRRYQASRILILEKAKVRSQIPEVKQAKQAYNKKYGQLNKEAILESKRQYRKHNVEKITARERLHNQKPEVKARKSEYNGRYYATNIQDILDYQKGYRQKNKKLLAEKAWVRVQNLLITDVQFRLKRHLRGLVGRILKGRRKVGSAVRDLGCTGAFCVQHLESQFYPNPITGEMMTWRNWGYGSGKWQIDHIRPLCSFDLPNREEFLKAFHYTNLQPLWFEDHNKKTTQDNKKYRKIKRKKK